MRKGLIGLFLIAMSVAGSAQADVVRVAALGDSLVHGYGLVPEQGFVPQLEQWLQAQGAEVELINAGVSGDTTAGGAARVDWTLSDDVDGMIVVLGGNDLLRGMAPEQARNNLQRILEAAQDSEVSVLLVGMRAPGNFGAEYKARFEAIYPELAQEYGALYFDNFFTGLDPNAEDLSSVQQYMQADGIHPNAEGVVRIVEAFGPSAMELVKTLEE